MNSVTRQQLRDWVACYSNERIAELVPEDGIAPLAVCELDIPILDKFCVLLRPEILPDRKLRQFACWCASRALRRIPSPDPRSRRAIRVAGRYSVGKASDQELAAARAAARAAAAAAWDAEWDAEWDAAWDAARDAEENTQLKRIAEMLRAQEGGAG
jgi:hypothetical protein